MQLSLQTFTSLVQNMAAAVQAAASQLIDLTVGSTTRAILEANASIALWMQWLILLVLQTTRAATSTGTDLDSWMADMSLTRLPAAAATGTVTFSRFTPTLAALIPAGALVRTADGSQTFAVSVDSSNPAWNASSSGYSLGAGVPSLDLPIVAITPGNAGNVQAGTITLLATAIVGIDTVINAAATQDGLDAESDPAFRARFQNFVQSRSRATPLAIGYAVSGIRQGLAYAVQENIDTTGGTRIGNFVVTVDDGSGSPPDTLLSTVSAAIEAVRPIGSTFTVQPPAVISADVSMTITVPSSVVKAPIVGSVGNALSAYINALPIGAPLPLTKVAQIAYATDPNVMNVSQVLLNGTAADIGAAAPSVIKAGVVAVN